MLSASLKPGRELSLKRHHPWIFSGAISSIPDQLADGDLVRVVSSSNEFLALGYCNRKSAITIRILSFQEVPIDLDFFIERFQVLRALKERRVPKEISDSYRLVFAESDHTPGLIVDKYNQTLVLQAHTLGIDRLKPLIVAALIKVFSPDTIYERSDVSVRHLEGLPTRPRGVLFGATLTEPVEIYENGSRFLVDVVSGQKTGFFLDQRDNRLALTRHLPNSAHVLNCFSYSGAFGVTLRRAGAASVINLDSSETALQLAEKNYALNNLIPASSDEFLQADAFEYLEDRSHETPSFDGIVLDPPAFTKSRSDTHSALKAYSRLNQLALRALIPGGILATSSCSGAISPDDFLSAVSRAAESAQTELRLLEARSASSDHASITSFPEGRYLKFFIFEKRSL